jgi:hypothetical protein
LTPITYNKFDAQEGLNLTLNTNKGDRESDQENSLFIQSSSPFRENKKFLEKMNFDLDVCWSSSKQEIIDGKMNNNNLTSSTYQDIDLEGNCMNDWLMHNNDSQKDVSVSDSNLLGSTLKIDDGSGDEAKSWIIDNGDQDFTTNHTNLRDEV